MNKQPHVTHVTLLAKTSCPLKLSSLVLSLLVLALFALDSLDSLVSFILAFLYLYLYPALLGLSLQA